MPQVSRPLIALLLGSIVFLALWMTALKPSSQSDGSSNATAFSPAISAAKRVAGLPTGAPPHAVADHAAAPAAHAAPAAFAAHTAPAHPALAHPAPVHAAPTHAAPAHATPAHAAPAHSAPVPAHIPTRSAAATHPAAAKPAPATGPAHRSAALHATGLGVASSDEQRLVAAVEAHRVAIVLFYNPASPQDVAQRDQLTTLSLPAGVLKLAVSINQLTDVPMITTATTINESPTYAVIDRGRQITTIVGYADAFELQQRVAQALAPAAR